MKNSALNRRDFMAMATASAAGLAFASPAWAAAPVAVPSYLKPHAELYSRDPKAAALAWFKEARFGLFMHYGLYSILGHGEWAMFHEQIPLAEYEKLKDRFRAEKFDADFITDLALAAGMKYVTITARHHEGFCLFDSQQTDYHSVNSPAKRDFIAELAEQCRKKSLGLFLYYSYAADWRHPYFYPREFCSMARPAYPNPEPRYLWKNPADSARYLDFVHAQLRELLTNYGPLAGIWFDPIMPYYARPDLFPVQETYALVRRLQPQTLIAFKQGATGTEDFAAPERSGQSLEARVRKQFGEASAKIAAAAWAANKSRHNEICDTLQPHVWGYKAADDGKHLDSAETLRRLAQAFGQNCNLLMNTGPLGDGSIHPADVKTLREVGKRIRANGWPAPVTAPTSPASATTKPKDGAAGQ